MPTRRSSILRMSAVSLLVGSACLLGACALRRGGTRGNANVPEPAKPVDLNRYLGRWYELARYVNRFERNCEFVTADYAQRPDGLIDVTNSCRKGGVDGPLDIAKGRAKVVTGSGNAKLKVSFFGPFFVGDYWVLDHGDDYEWSIVGAPGGRYLWVLAREPVASKERLGVLVERVRELGYDTGLLRLTRQG